MTIDKYTLYTDRIFNRDFKKYHDHYVCPCCNYPTLHGRMGYEICGLCDWEDDGQDDENANEVLGGPNTDYSLTEARDNFAKYFTMYRPEDKAQFARFDKNKILPIKEVYDIALNELDKTEINTIIKKAHRLEGALRK